MTDRTSQKARSPNGNGPTADLGPHSEDAERALIGSIMIGGADILAKCGVKLTDFCILKNQWIFEAMQSIAARGEDIAFTALKAELEHMGKWADIPTNHLSDCQNKPESYLYYGTYAAIVREGSHQRQALNIAGKVAQAASSGNKVALQAAINDLNRLNEEAAPAH